MPWLHTVTWAVRGWPGRTLAGPVTAVTTKSDRWPTPTRPPTLLLLVSMNSIRLFIGSTMAPR